MKTATKTKSKVTKAPPAKTASKAKAMPILAVLAGGKLPPATRKEIGKPQNNAPGFTGHRRVGRGKK